MEDLPLIALVGPTAVGKTAVGIAMARMLGGEIISADAVSVYRGLDIGSAKPTLPERQGVPFHLLDVVQPDQDFTLADFARLAEEAIAGIRERGHVPIVVGGTGLYVRSVTATLTMPNVAPQPELRAALWAIVAAQGAVFLHERLQRVDPQAAEKILPGDAKRIIRALEVYEVTGQPITSFHTPEGVRGVPRANTCLLGLTMGREQLYRRIEARVDAMMAAGFVREVEELMNAGYGSEKKAMQSLGYRHVMAHIQGAMDWESTVAELKRDTRRFAKRQMIWFNADPNLIWYDVDKDVSSEDTEGIKSLAETIAEALIKRLPQK